MPAHPYTTCPIILEDKALLVVDKPSGVLSHPNRSTDENVAFPGPYDADARRFETPGGPLWLIHRLDEDTSGVLLAAKTEQAAKLCREAFEADRVRKRYLALVLGAGLSAEGAWLDHLSTEARRGKARSKVVLKARPNAELHFKRLHADHVHKLSLLEIDLYTGKTHQIRVQAAHRRHPVAGDDVYGDFAANRALRKDLGLMRLFLHAKELEIIHPVTKKHLKLKSALPEDLSEVLKVAALRSPP